MATITTKDGTQIFYKDWGKGQPIVFSHGWPLSADDWDGQMLFFGQRGYRVIAHDRRGHGRSDQTWDGNEMDTYADDLARPGAKISDCANRRCGSPVREDTVKNATLKVYPSFPHGIPATNADQINADLLTFFKGAATAASS